MRLSLGAQNGGDHREVLAKLPNSLQQILGQSRQEIVINARKVNVCERFRLEMETMGRKFDLEKG